MTVIYFTATGNSLSVAKRIGGTLLSAVQLIKQEKYDINDDTVGIVCPVYCADVPRLVRNWLEKAHITANYTFFILTYGYLAGEATLHAEEYLKHAAGHTDYVAKVIMVDTALARFETEKQIRTLPEKHVEEQLTKILENIRTRKHEIRKTSIFDKAVDWLYHTAGASQTAPEKARKTHYVSDNCIRCGICAEVCPTDNIIVGENVEFQNKCEGCLACIHNCPQKAMHMKGEQSSARFRNGEITISEIIAANN